jgi:hypothetical protein
MQTQKNMLHTVLKEQRNKSKRKAKKKKEKSPQAPFANRIQGRVRAYAEAVSP